MKFLRVSILLLVLLLLAGTSLVFAQGADVAAGAQLYDKWYAVTGTLPEGDMPIWSRQSSNTRSGPETWRCSECHGWDYRGYEGGFAAGSHYTGFPGILRLVQPMTTDEIVDHLKGGKDPAHDFSAYLSESQMQQLAVFLKEGLIDDAQYIDSVSLQVLDGDPAHGKTLYESTCAKCHGADGGQIVFRGEGIDETLGDVARRDPFRFLHRTRFGVAGTQMPVGVELGWAPEDGRDVLAYAQTLPASKTPVEPGPAAGESEPAPTLGGPANDLWSGIVTGVAAFLGTIGASILFLSVLVGIGVLVVWALRGRKKS
jgi:thiosulfate dehydrogenase